MEAPTPVSALMHAGIINAGGFLVIRLSPLISLSRHPGTSTHGPRVGALHTGALIDIFRAVAITSETAFSRSAAIGSHHDAPLSFEPRHDGLPPGCGY